MLIYRHSFQSKLPEVPTSIFSVMSALAHKENALNLSQGFPDFESDKNLINMVHKAMVNGKNQYAPMPGIFSLRQAISNKMEHLYGVSYNPETEITITAGATQAIFTAIATTVKKDDEVLIFKPAYDCYEPTIQLFGGKAIAVQLDPESFIIDWKLVKSLITDKTRMIIVNTPHNPSGRILTAIDMLQLENILKDTNILLLSDEVYEHIIFDGELHQTAALYPVLAERAFITASFGKTFHNTGWKIGYCLAPKELMAEFRKVHQFNVFSVNHPTQVALAEYLKTPSNYLNLNNFYQQKRDLFLSLIKDTRFEFIPSKGTYFQLLNFKNITDESDYDFAIRLTKEQKIASVPISVFNENGLDTKVLRFCFAKTDETIKKAAEILCNI
ncbi:MULTISPECIES: methionine aminotransferase [Flavobacteriaceae]|uniref:Aminotransferase class I/II-fold pyridoxal phosphate-dependent enzyme n=2 Tax=Flavobacteriaceae TaxID=49546 RepID=A0A4Y8AR72_9FLAO|nr:MULTISPECIES: methionine aminotransferase [Flavobacteriaceae]TEW73654.1 aminotransferase class I/II-fold pyridoxal phosphate-dependent enzyme [Gramella jeungdoensis]GGK36449.1 aminotransferase [Lutibacter litoralis]